MGGEEITNQQMQVFYRRERTPGSKQRRSGP